MHGHFHLFRLSLVAVIALAGCGSSSHDDTQPNPPSPDPMACSPIFCEDEIILDMSLQGAKVSTGTVTNTADGADWVSVIDATAGGVNGASNNPFIYLKFTTDGLVKVDIDDETALTSTNWDLAARRYTVRLNGGTSGAGCVGAAALGDEAYADVTTVPSGLTYAYDQSYDASCTIIEDDSGLPGSPQTALRRWWDYVSCVETTFTPFVIQLANGDHVKFVLEAYYGTGQAACNESGAMGNASAMLTARWAYL